MTLFKAGASLALLDETREILGYVSSLHSGPKKVGAWVPLMHLEDGN